MTKDQRHALRQLLDSVEKQEKWDYFKRGGWAGHQLYELLESANADDPANLANNPMVIGKPA